MLYSQGVVKDGDRIADIGAGTGISSQPFLEAGHEVVAVEPNREMRLAAEALRGHYSNFHSNSGTAEETKLENDSVDLVFSAQAFHWFDFDKAQVEFKRILKPDGKVCLVWNERLTEETAFLTEYEDFLINNSPDYTEINHVRPWEPIFQRFFTNGEFYSADLPNEQIFDLEGLRGRVRSTSYLPAPGDDGFEKMDKELVTLFDKHQESGKVEMKYRTAIFWGHPA